ncbi:MAG: hypothetical protein K0S21_3688 [Rhizobiaceae bacterium]|nr:hypothetical protein [Rhizobiaceae bacterium]
MRGGRALIGRGAVLRRRALAGRGAEARAATSCCCAVLRRCAVFCRRALADRGAETPSTPAAFQAPAPAAAAASQGDRDESGMSSAVPPDRAGAEIAFCESVLAKAGLNVLSETFREVSDITAWNHYPPGDVFDPASGAQWFYHCHPAEAGAAEHGHFHCFVRPEGVEGPIHQLAAVGVDRFGRLLRLFTVNQWVVGDDWADAKATVALLDRFDVEMPRPSYLVNRWLTAVISAHRDRIGELLRARDERLAAHRSEGPARQDRSLEVTSEFVFPEGLNPSG